MNATEKRETDEVAGYQFTSAKKEVEDNGKNKREKEKTPVAIKV